LPRVLDELSSGAIHLTAFFLLDRYLNEENAEELLSAARGASRRELEKILAMRFPRPDVPSTIALLDEAAGSATGGAHRDAASGPGAWFTCPGAGTSAVREDGDLRSRVEPLSSEGYRVQFTASAALRAKIEQARELTSHALPSGDLGLLFERALDELIERELKRRGGAGNPRRVRKLQAGSRHVPLTIARRVWERDDAQCTFVDQGGRRCEERRFLTLEHRLPFALGGPPTIENLCLLCSAHNAHTARRVFGEALIARRVAAREARTASIGDVAHGHASEEVRRSPTHLDAFTKVRSALTHMGFPERTVASTVLRLRRDHAGLEVEPLLRAALNLLTPPPS
jgi:hypothetical protein